MSGRCRACDVILSEQEMKKKWPGSDDYCDLCSYCLHAADEDYDYEILDEDDVTIDTLPETLDDY